MNNEIWKQIKEAPDYSVSNFGRVRMNGRTIIDSNGVIRTYQPHIVAVSYKKCGYLEVRLTVDNNKSIYRTIHRLVLSTFNPVDNMENMEVNHKDENKHNNNLENLEWVTSKENCNYGTRNRKCGDARAIKVRCIETGEIYNSGKEASELTGTCTASISRCLHGKSNKAGGYSWEVVYEQ